MTAGKCAIAIIVVATVTWLVIFGLRFHDQEGMAANGLIPVLLGTNVVRPYEPAPLVELRAGLKGADFDQALHAELARRLADERKQLTEWHLRDSDCGAIACRIPFMESLSKANHREHAYQIYVAAIQEANANAYGRLPKWLIALAVPLAIIFSSACGLFAVVAGSWKVPLYQLPTARCLGVAACLSAGWIAMYAYTVPVQLPLRTDRIEMLGRYPSYFEIPIHESVALPFGEGLLELNPGLDWPAFAESVTAKISGQDELLQARDSSIVVAESPRSMVGETQLRTLYGRYVELSDAYLERRRREWVAWLSPLLAVPSMLLMLLCGVAATRGSTRQDVEAWTFGGNAGA